MGGRRTDGFKVKPTEVGDIFEVPTRLLERLARNMESCIAKSEGHKYVSICSDKAAVGGFNLHTGLIALADGTAIVPPPQVRAASGGCPGELRRQRFWGPSAYGTVRPPPETFRILTSHTIRCWVNFNRKNISWISPKINRN